MKTVREICTAIMNDDCERLFGDPFVKRKYEDLKQALEEIATVQQIDDLIAMLEIFGTACATAGYENGFRTAWNLVKELEG